MVYFLTLRISIFEKFMLDDILVTLQLETVQSDIVWYYPRSILPFRGMFQVLHPSFRCVNTIQKVCRPVSSFVQVQQGRRNKTICIVKSDCLAFKTNIFCISVKNHKGILFQK